MFKFIFSCLLLLIVCSLTNCDRNPDSFIRNGVVADANLLVGRWYGQFSDSSSRSRRWITERKDDGTFVITYELSIGGAVTEQGTESGSWSLSAGHYHTRTEMVNGQKVNLIDPYFNDTYTVLNLTSEHFEYKHLTTKRRYDVRKVPPNFSL